jgi:hypothetical protein
MIPFDECPVCGGELLGKNVEKLLRGEIHWDIQKTSIVVV